MSGVPRHLAVALLGALMQMPDRAMAAAAAVVERNIPSTEPRRASAWYFRYPHANRSISVAAAKRASRKRANLRKHPRCANGARKSP